MAPFHSLHRKDSTTKEPLPLVPKPNPGQKITPYISARTFFELFTATVCLFFVGVLLWKVGQFLRFLTQTKVLGGRKNKKSSPRYAKTWYGWIRLSRHEANKQVFRNCSARIREWTAWKSSKDDYSWIWWDPGQKKLRKHLEDKRSLRFLPSFLRSYEALPADEFWDPGPCGNRPCSVVDDLAAIEPGTSSVRSRMLFPGYTPFSGSPGTSSFRLGLPMFRSYSADGFWPGARPVRLYGQNSDSSLCRGRLPEQPANRRRMPIYFRGQSFSREEGHNSLALAESSRHVPRPPASASCLVDTKSRYASVRPLSGPSLGVDGNEAYRIHAAPSASNEVHFSQKYQAWSTKMQMQTCNPRQHAPQEPPGSPIAELLGSFASEGGSSFRTLRRLRGSLASNLSLEHGTTPMSLRKGYRKLQDAGIEDDRVLFPSETKTIPFRKSTRRTPLNMENFACHLEPHNDLIRQKPETNKRAAAYDQPRNKPNSPGRLDEWDARLLDGLDRKLGWFQREIAPGRKPFHFPTLANHWLNSNCWQVGDPSSRQPLNAQRLCGDPRFNTPYPEPRYGARPRYPARLRRRERIPRIDSWRKMINKQRLQTGQGDIIRARVVFDSSTEEPHDGAIDPACWILRKPPQGFGMSRKQQNAFYGGGSGWQEKLDDWQRVGRGYRIRKIIHEGRANRTRAKELAVSITRACHIISSKIAVSHPQGENGK